MNTVYVPQQSKKMSFYESLTNVSVGYIFAVASQLIIFPLFGIYLPLADNLIIGLYFTVLSIVRSYALRRVFNRIKG
jgi:hypothetical protein